MFSTNKDVIFNHFFLLAFMRTLDANPLSLLSTRAHMCSNVMSFLQFVNNKKLHDPWCQTKRKQFARCYQLLPSWQIWVLCLSWPYWQSTEFISVEELLCSSTLLSVLSLSLVLSLGRSMRGMMLWLNSSPLTPALCPASRPCWSACLTWRGASAASTTRRYWRRNCTA